MRLPTSSWAMLFAAAMAACAHHEAGPTGVDAPDVQASIPLPPVSITQGANGPVQVFIATGDTSGEVVEPDVVRVPGGWHGFEYWMAINPYQNGDDAYENASIYASNDGLAWSVPDGLHNPVVPFPSGITGHNSDPDLVFVPDPGRLILFDRAVTRDANELREQTSDDGITWSAPVAVMKMPKHDLVSPAIALVPGRRARLWYVETGTLGCDAKSTMVVMRRWMGEQSGPGALIGTQWSNAVGADLAPPPGYVIWHIDVIYVPELHAYWAIFPAHHANESCAYNDLFAARSRDGLHWTTLQQPLIKRGAAGFVGQTLYRSSLVYDSAAASIGVWFSGADGFGRWHLGYQAFQVSELVNAIAHQRRH